MSATAKSWPIGKAPLRTAHGRFAPGWATPGAESARRVRYQKANRAVGLCASCPNWSGERFLCKRHRKMQRAARARRRAVA